MATGSNTFKGLAVPLQGESNITQLAIANDILTITAATSNTSDYLVCENSSGTENFFVKSTGNVRINATNTASHFCMDIRDAASAATGWNGAGNFELTIASDFGAGGTQTTALRACLNATGSSTSGGREACLNLYYKTSSSLPSADRSFIFCDDGGTGAHVFLNLGANLALGTSCWTDAINAEATATKGIIMYHGTDKYYIMVTSCVA